MSHFSLHTRADHALRCRAGDGEGPEEPPHGVRLPHAPLLLQHVHLLLRGTHHAARRRAGEDERPGPRQPHLLAVRRRVQRRTHGSSAVRSHEPRTPSLCMHGCVSCIAAIDVVVDVVFAQRLRARTTSCGLINAQQPVVASVCESVMREEGSKGCASQWGCCALLHTWRAGGHDTREIRAPCLRRRCKMHGALA